MPPAPLLGDLWQAAASQHLATQAVLTGGPKEKTSDSLTH